MNYLIKFLRFVAITFIILFQAVNASAQTEGVVEVKTFQDDVDFMSQHTNIVLLENDGAAVAIAPDYQGRVMTSTVDREDGASFGWINRKVIEAGILPEAEREGLEAHIYIFGGEERFWLGPEGGQFALFFKPGTKFEFSDWTTPAAIDTEPFELSKQTETAAEFKRDCELTNYSGTKFQIGIQRTVTLLDSAAVAKALGAEALPAGVQVVAYETDNRVTNQGENAWTAEKGLPSIWLLGMYNPSPNTTLVIPLVEGDESSLGPPVKDDYFGKVPAEHLSVEKDVLFFRGDGTRRGKIGVSSKRSKGIAGSYDADGKVLTIVTYNQQESPNGFVNSMWEHQENPYQGDVINAYNDGSPAPGEPPLGPFYELETSSPAAALAPGETMRHVQRTMHIQGTEESLTPIANALLGVSVAEIKAGQPK